MPDADIIGRSSSIMGAGEKETPGKTYLLETRQLLIIWAPERATWEQFFWAISKRSTGSFGAVMGCTMGCLGHLWACVE